MSANRDATIALVSTTSMTDLLNITAGTTDESIVDDIINEVSRLVLKITGRSTILATSLTEYYDGDDSRTLLTKAYPINSITSLYIDPDRDYGSDTLVASSYYMIDTDEGRVKLDGAYFSAAFQSIKITYNAGWSTCPYDLQRAVKMVVSHWYNQTKDNRIGISSRSDAGQSTTYEQNLPRGAATIIKRYRDHRDIL